MSDPDVPRFAPPKPAPMATPEPKGKGRSKGKDKGKGKGKVDADGRRPGSPPGRLVHELALLRLAMSLMIGSLLLCENGPAAVAGVKSRH